ncbi:diguanylate cyclase (GGDEF)-like protein/PAS domain S-box-containing protein [Kitasatospora sp. GAS204A]|uniref:putative bifunctional diguanylate cyclase/phosphodiesterase n=1 Tax=unclassified Kitasatospora TaxID=2633591 RepID=UPI0024746C81|nr:EAL domain-containing protein [Kitasatospora sp. GAS204B]MDH6116250.1 diguanylate cyclase (GGDEF)-like protein/PAS domain S-box-containing protein [Kitasatospora sp. GAS204B]
MSRLEVVPQAVEPPAVASPSRPHEAAAPDRPSARPPARPQPPAGRLPGLLIALLCAGYALGAATGWGSPSLATFMGDFGLAGAALAAAFSCLAHGCTVPGSARPAWLLFGLSSVCVAVGNGTWGWYEVVQRTTLPADSFADYAFLPFAPLTLTGLLVLAQRPRGAAGWLCLLLDGWLVAGSLFTLSWSLALGRAAEGEVGDPVRVIHELAYPVLDILMVSLVVGLRFRGRDGNRAAVHTAMLGLAVTVVCDGLFTTPSVQASYHSGSLLDAGWFAGSLLLASAPWSSRWRRGRPSREHPSAGGTPRRRVASTFSALTPYAAAAVCTAGILYNALGGHPMDRVVIVVACTVGLALIVRQGIMLLDNLSLAQELAQKEAHFRSLVQGSSDVIMITGANGVLSYVSPAALGVYSRDPEELVGGRLLDLVHPEDTDRVVGEVRRFLARSQRLARQLTHTLPARSAEPSARVECRIKAGGGEWLHVESTVNRYRDGLILNSRDVTERVRLQAQLQHNAFHDPLTDLPNRALFAERLRAALGGRGGEGPREHPYQEAGTVAVLFLDLDGFKAVNDTAGHQVGDQLLVQAGRRLQATVRSGDTVARFGGDEFAVLVCGPLGRLRVQELAERLRLALSEPYWIGGAELAVAASIGIAFGPRDLDPYGPPVAEVAALADELMRDADLAMYRAKSEGKGRVVLYSPAMRAEVERRRDLDDRLRLAVREGGFALLHQPVVDLRTGAVAGLEAIARWRSAQGLLLTPAEFLRGAEAGDAAGRFTRWLLQQAIAEAALRGAALGSAGRGQAGVVPVTIRLTAERLCAPGVHETVAGALRDCGLPPERLVIELARTSSDAAADELGRKLAALRRLGVGTALAGFGAGGGSLGTLVRLPFDALKLDRTLVQELAENPRSRALAGHALRLGRELGLATGAEGVDQERQVSVLQELGCRHGQGLAFAQPLDEFRLRRALVRRLYPLPRPLGAVSARRAYLSAAADTRSGGCGEAGPGRAAHHHGAHEPPEHRP